MDVSQSSFTGFCFFSNQDYLYGSIDFNSQNPYPRSVLAFCCGSEITTGGNGTSGNGISVLCPESGRGEINYGLISSSDFYATIKNYIFSIDFSGVPSYMNFHFSGPYNHCLLLY